MLKAAGIVVLVFCLHGYRLIQGQFPLVHRLERGHHDGDFTGAGRGNHHVAVALQNLAGS